MKYEIFLSALKKKFCLSVVLLYETYRPHLNYFFFNSSFVPWYTCACWWQLSLIFLGWYTCVRASASYFAEERKVLIEIHWNVEYSSEIEAAKQTSVELKTVAGLSRCQRPKRALRDAKDREICLASSLPISHSVFLSFSLSISFSFSLPPSFFRSLFLFLFPFLSLPFSSSPSLFPVSVCLSVSLFLSLSLSLFLCFFLSLSLYRFAFLSVVIAHSPFRTVRTAHGEWIHRNVDWRRDEGDSFISTSLLTAVISIENHPLDLELIPLNYRTCINA